MGFGCLSATVGGNKRFPTMNLDPDGDGLGGGEEGKKNGIEPARGKAVFKRGGRLSSFFRIYI